MKTHIALFVSLTLAACGGDGRLRGTLRACTDDMQCPVGEICVQDLGQCVLFDRSQTPKPNDSKELLTRLGSLVFALPEATGDVPGLLSMDVVVLDTYHLRLTHPLAGGTVRAKLDGDILRVWNLRAAADGGGVSVSAPSGQTSNADVYVTDLSLESRGEASGMLSMEPYPASNMQTSLPMTLRAKIGASIDHMAAVEFIVEDVALNVHFDVAERTLVADLAFSGAWDAQGIEKILRIEAISVATRFSSVELPAQWAR